MASIKCDVKGCSYVAVHHKPGYVNALIGVHKSKVHGIPGQSPAAKSHRKKVALVKSPVKPEPAVVEEREIVPVNFCPCCGTNLRAITVALNLRKR